MTSLLHFVHLALLHLDVLQGFFKLDVTLVNLKPVVILAKTTDLFPKFFKVMGPFH